MKRVDVGVLHVDPHSITPIYRQLAGSIAREVESGRIAKNEVLPSLHELCVALDVSRGTVEKAYRMLMKMGVVGSVQGKGYFVVGEVSSRQTG